ncbi:hypothetical protein [Catenulispora pinisilvae]|nr:hypothetical protein [Catenulispora pinisilvae]
MSAGTMRRKQAEQRKQPEQAEQRKQPKQPKQRRLSAASPPV